MPEKQLIKKENNDEEIRECYIGTKNLLTQMHIGEDFTKFLEDMFIALDKERKAQR